MHDYKKFNLKVTKKGTTFKIDDVQISYWYNYINWSRTVIDYHDVVLPSWASFLYDDINKWFENNIETVHNIPNYSEVHIQL